jgi:hypothetical protein
MSCFRYRLADEDLILTSIAHRHGREPAGKPTVAFPVPTVVFTDAALRGIRIPLLSSIRERDRVGIHIPCVDLKRIRQQALD